MSTLATSIREYYFTHFDKLSDNQQFHFVSRLSAWDNDPQALAIIDTMRPALATNSIYNDLLTLANNPPSAKINAAMRRAPYFAQYPELRGWMLALFRVRHLLFHYRLDTRKALLEIIPKTSLYTLSDKLRSDKEAVSILSTYAINYIYLVEAILFPRNNPEFKSFITDIIELADIYDDSAEDSLLLIYLFTHCIIGASNFYQSAVPESEYHTMLSVIESRIARHFDKINLDNKFEFLVCCQITSFQTHLRERIQQEAAQSLSPNGTYLIDTVNQAGQSDKQSFADSEHRNVLYIMSQSTFQHACLK